MGDKNDPQDVHPGGHFPKTTFRTSVMGDTRTRMSLRTCTLGDTFQKQPSGPVSWGTQGQEDKSDPQDLHPGGHFPKTTLMIRTSVMGDTRARMTPRTCTLGDTFHNNLLGDTLQKRPSGPVSWGTQGQE